MISVSEARKIIAAHVRQLPPEKINIADASGLVLAEDIVSPIDLPSFRQSSMDGYAFRYSDWAFGKTMTLSGLSQAGKNTGMTLAKNTAVRIFTGALVPDGSDTVVMQEKVTSENGEIAITDENIKPGDNVRPIGMEIKKGEPALRKNTLLNPAAIGFLATLGISEMSVYRRPSVTIIVTGNELQQPGTPLEPGEVYDANSYALSAALQRSGIRTIRVQYAKDALDQLTQQLQKALEASDVIFLTGGISVGDYDFVLQATINNGVEKLFHRVKQRPAKPLYFGKKEGKYVFGLPGNPASGLTSYYLYALPALDLLMNRELSLKQLKAPLASAFTKKPGLTTFLKGFYDGHTVTMLDAQESFRLSSFAHANCLIEIEELSETSHQGDLVQINMLPE